MISPCGRYRYRLERDLRHPGPVATFIMANPSLADGEVDDPTIRRCVGFASLWGLGRIVIVNLCAYRAADIRALRLTADPVGPDNDRHIEKALRDGDLHVAAWGCLAKLPPQARGRWREVSSIAEQMGCRLHCFGTAKDGQPLHPLYLSYGRKLIPFAPGRP